MYCILQYLDNLRQEQQIQEDLFQTLRTSGSSDVDTYNTRMYFNPNCILQLILDYILSEAHIDIDGEKNDLCNNSGDLLSVKDYKPTVSGLAIFHPRETYYVVMIKRNETKTQIDDIIPVLHPSSEIYKALLKNVKEKNFLKKRSSFFKRSKSSKLTLSKHSITQSQSSNTSNPESKERRRSSAHL